MHTSLRISYLIEQKDLSSNLFMWNFQTVVADELKFGTKFYITKVPLCDKFWLKPNTDKNT